MAAENAVVQKLLADTDVTDICGTRIDHVMNPQGDAVPRVTVQRAGTRHIESLVNSSGLAYALVRVISTAATKEDLDDLSDAIRQSLQGYRGVVGTEQIYVDGVEDERDVSEAPSDGDDRPVLQWSQDFGIWYCPAVPVHA